MSVTSTSHRQSTDSTRTPPPLFRRHQTPQAPAGWPLFPASPPPVQLASAPLLGLVSPPPPDRSAQTNPCPPIHQLTQPDPQPPQDPLASPPTALSSRSVPRSLTTRTNAKGRGRVVSDNERSEARGTDRAPTAVTEPKQRRDCSRRTSESGFSPRAGRTTGRSWSLSVESDRFPRLTCVRRALRAPVTRARSRRSRGRPVRRAREDGRAT